MTFQLKSIFSIPGESKEFEYEIDRGKLFERTGIVFHSDVKVKGSIVNRAGVVKLVYHCDAAVDHVCDRCLCEFVREYGFDFEHILVTDTKCDDYVVCNDFELDLDELAVCDMLLEFPTKILCKEDCKGLCAKCGADLNKGECSCVRDN